VGQGIDQTGEQPGGHGIGIDGPARGEGGATGHPTGARGMQEVGVAKEGLPATRMMTLGVFTMMVFAPAFSPAQQPVPHSLRAPSFLQQSLQQHPQSALQPSLQHESAVVGTGSHRARAPVAPDAATNATAAIHQNHRVIGRASFSSRRTGTGGGP
jgi:hypothetical protein